MSLGKSLGLKDLGICVGKLDLFERPNENRCKNKINNDVEITYLKANLNEQQYDVEFTWEKENYSTLKLILNSVQISLLISLMIIFPILYFTISSIFKKVDATTRDILHENMENSQLSPSQNKNPIPTEFYEISLFIKEKMLELKNATKDKVLAEIAMQVAHDIRSPLMAPSVVSKQLSDSSGGNEELKTILKSSIDRINGISDDLLKSGKELNTSSDFAEVNLNALVEMIVKEKNSILSDKKMNPIRIDLNLSSETIVKANKLELSRILSNIINNSIEAIDPVHGSIQLSIKESLLNVELSILDNGIGIPAEIINTLGQQGFSFGKNNAANGIGLYHAKKFMEHFKGELKIHSTLTKGTEINLIFPKVIARSESSFKALPSEIVLFEDDKIVQLSWTFQAKKLGIALHLFNNLSEFYLFQSSNPIDKNIAIYSDINLSNNVSGLDIVEELHSAGYNNLHLSTGMELTKIKIPNYIKSVSDKSFPLIKNFISN